MQHIISHPLTMQLHCICTMNCEIRRTTGNNHKYGFNAIRIYFFFEFGLRVNWIEKPFIDPLPSLFSMWLICLFFIWIALTFPMQSAHKWWAENATEIWSVFVGWLIRFVFHIIIMYCICQAIQSYFVIYTLFSNMYNPMKESSKWANFINYTDFCLQFSILWSSNGRIK